MSSDFDLSPSNNSGFIFNPNGYLSEPSEAPPLDISLNYIRQNYEILGLSAADVENVTVTAQHETDGTTYLYLQQQINGLAVENSTLNIAITENGQILSIGNRFGRGVESLNNATPTVNAQQAVQTAASQWGLVLEGELAIAENSDSDSTPNEIIFAGGNISKSNIPAKLVYDIQDNGEIRLVWNVTLDSTQSSSDWGEINIDAQTGEVLREHRYAAHANAPDANYNVVRLPDLGPIESPPALISNPHRANPAASPYGWHDTDEQPGAEYTITRGNNVYAYEDKDGDDRPGYSPNGGPTLNFNFPFNPSLGADSADNLNAVITNTFYWTNIAHDIFYRYGFTEAAGNFQFNNYGKGGEGGDGVVAEVLDAFDKGTRNNANFATPTDGTAPRMQMYASDPPSGGQLRSTDLDSEILLHEYAHGVTNRLTGGPNNDIALEHLQSAGMGEGWGDFFAFALTRKPTNNRNIPYTLGSYAFSPNGVRSRPYNFSLTVQGFNVQPETHSYGDINNYLTTDPEKQNPHRIGEVWAATLIDLYWNFVDPNQDGVNDSFGDIYTGNEGNNKAIQLVMDGLKLQPANPTFLQARDAILLADRNRYGGANQKLIWETFARRGMGSSAQDGGNANSLQVTEAVDLPANLTPPSSTGTLVFTKDSYTVVEGSEGVNNATVIKVARIGGTSGVASVNVGVVEGGTATGGSSSPADYNNTQFPIKIEFADGEGGEKEVSIPILGDTTFEPNETINLQLGRAIGANLGSRLSTTLFLENDDSPAAGTLEFAAANSSGAEGSSGSAVDTVVATIKRTNGTEGQVSVKVQLQTYSGSDAQEATAGSDYTNNLPITVTFASGETEKEVKIPIVGDIIPESNEFISLKLVEPTGGATLGNLSSTAYTITNDDNPPAPGTFEFASVVNSGVEGNSGNPQDTVVAKVQRTGGSDGTATVDVVLDTNFTDATEGEDFTNPLPITLTFNPGETQKDVVIPIVADTDFEPDDFVSLVLKNPTGGAIISEEKFYTDYTIENDDADPTANTGVIEFTEIFSEGEEGDGGSTDTVVAKLKRTGASEGVVTVDVLFDSDFSDVTPNEDFINNLPITITFEDGDTAEKEVVIPIVGDTVSEEDEFLGLLLDNPTGGATIGENFYADYGIINDDGSPGILEFTSTVFSDPEGNSNTTSRVVAEVQRTGGTAGEVSVQVLYDDFLAGESDTAVPGNDFTNNLPITITFADGDTAIKKVEIPIAGDTLFEEDEFLDLQLASPTGGAELGEELFTSYAIENDDREFVPPPINAPLNPLTPPTLPDSPSENNNSGTDSPGSGSSGSESPNTVVPGIVFPTPTPNSGTVPIAGTNEDDVIFGTDAAEAIAGLGGNDFLYGRESNDNLSGDEGNDLLHGNQGNDFLNGGSSDDWIHAGQGNDAILGDQGNDVLFGDLGNDLIFGGNDNDFLNGNQGDDSLDGGAGMDTLHGGQGNDILIGSSGNDFLYGDKGDDTVVGVDTRSATPGQGEIDFLTGGEGSDLFVLGDSTRVYYDGDSNGGYAILTDFNAAQDRIQLKGSAANYLLFSYVDEGSNLPRTDIYLDKPGTETDELIGVVQGVSDLSLQGNYFNFV
ncbi:M36 family metallopeptidase [Laspinema sp. D1]|uniref:M36 family metallopeptidase n=1 Tax=Laspinema palackyanum D2a TaxID=2953684 RepID=A0ABT2MKD2_9CYAN|nr:M36 family metallopeptidase [Laspinema sp. D2a]